MKYLRLFRIILAAPFVLLGAMFYGAAELISGEKYVRHADLVERNTIFSHNMHQANKMNEARMRTGGKGFRTPKRK